MKDNATYVYCVVKSSKAPALGRSRSKAKPCPPGLEGTGKPRFLDAGDGFYMLAATAPLELYDGPVIDGKLRDLDWVGGRAAEHEGVVEFATDLGTVVPMKLFTMFGDDARAIDNVRGMKKSLQRVVERIEDCEEWGLRILFDEARAARAAAEAARGAKPTSGKDFLLRKKVLNDERRSSGARGAAEVDELYQRLAKTCRSAKKRAAPNRELAGSVLLDAVFLVPRSSVSAVRKTVTASAKKLVADGFDVALTGPWPAYSFIGGK